ncbi:hypothetical protein GTO27_04030, partial [Candidatus Bathyarchaeota archaeon]|nr:hypothetical protein [Candidatus Bathyarchaeota archaeon]
MSNRMASVTVLTLLLGLQAVTSNIQPLISLRYYDRTIQDVKFERFGPRADRLLIKLYKNETAEWDALANGDIDVADWPLTKSYYDLFASNETNPATGFPYNETIDSVPYGSQTEFYILDINNDPRQYLGYSDLNPVYPNPCSLKEFRQSIAYLVNRSKLDMIIGDGFYAPLYTVVPPYMGTYCHPDIKPSGLLENLTYPCSRAKAAALLNASGFPINTSTGWRFWDRNDDGIEQASEHLELKFLIREDDHRLAFGNFIADELEAVRVRVIRREYPILPQQIMERDFHLYTGKWNLGIDPTHLIIWHSSSYWSGFCYNYAFVNDTELDEHIDGIIYAESLEEAVENTKAAQERFAEMAAGVPLWACLGFKAASRHYTGGNAGQSVIPDDGENEYRGQQWKGIVNIQTRGIDNFWSFLNMRPTNFDRGNGENMTIRWG